MVKITYTESIQKCKEDIMDCQGVWVIFEVYTSMFIILYLAQYTLKTNFGVLFCRNYRPRDSLFFILWREKYQTSFVALNKSDFFTIQFVSILYLLSNRYLEQT